MIEETGSANSPFDPAAFIGIDRSDRSLDICLQEAGGKSTHRTIDSAPESVQAWIGEVRSRFAGAPVALCLWSAPLNPIQMKD